MPTFPRIDRPCPLARADQEALGQDCSHCGKTVHALDGLDVVQRQALMRNASGPVCVSYRLPIHLGAALALSLAGSVQAAPQDVPSSAPGQVPTSAPFEIPGQAAETQVTPVDLSPGLDQIMVGGVSKPGEAEWIDNDPSVPELPIVHRAPQQSR